MIKKNQQGATLIIVLMLLLAITIIGTLAVRQGLVSLNIATNSQAVQLMTQSSDAAMFRVEDSTNLARSLAKDGMFGFIKSDNNKGRELVFCFRGSQTQFFNLSQASLVYEDSGEVINTAMGTSGFCQANDNSQNFFTSNRRAVMTQVSISFSGNSAGSQPFEDAVRGTDDDVPIEKSEKVVVHAISLMPTLSSAPTSDIDDCLKLLSNTTSTNANISITSCLTDLNVPFTAHVTEYALGQGFKNGV